MEGPVLFVSACAVLLLVPGPTNALLAAAGAMAGFKKSLHLAPAELCGYLISGNVIWLTLRPVMDAHPLVVGVLKAACAGYLIYLAFDLYFRGHAVAPGASKIGFSKILIVSLLNPKVLILASVIFPSPDRLAGYELGWYNAVFSALVLMASTVWISIGASIRALTRDAGDISAAVSKASSVCLVALTVPIVRSIFP